MVTESSSTWPQLLKPRPMAEDFITFKVGNRKECSFCFDVWTSFGKPISYIGLDGPKLYGLPLDAKVSQAVTQNGWLKNPIRDFCKVNYSDVEKRTKEAHEALLVAQDTLLANPTDSNVVAEAHAQEKWRFLDQAEESFFCQRSSISWLELGDNNTAFFHRMVNSRNSLNFIHFLDDANGNRVDSQDGIQNLCVSYFTELLGPPVDSPMFVQSDLNLLQPFSCSNAQKDALTKSFTRDEIKNAFFSLPRSKTCGPDGYSAEFFRADWDIVGPEVSDAILEFFQTGKMLKQWNSTTLVLIPKVPNASSPSEFRPISCLNTVYKVIFKLLAGRLKEIMSGVVSLNQTAFMSGRLLAENVLLASDLVQRYTQKNSERKAMLKVDLRKAFDTIRWDFIIGTLKALDIPHQFISWISECISTPSFSVCVNGATGGFFQSTKGIRQGDPLSPYLFVLAMEVFSKLLLSRFKSGAIGYHPTTEDLNISHLMFADDLMVFFDGTTTSLHGISECLDDFASWSGLKVNMGKSELFLAGLNHGESTVFSSYGFTTGSLPIRYLGLPLMSRKLKISEYEPLIHHLRSKFQAWAIKSLSFSGRVQLLKSVIAGMVNFWISAFIIPQGCINRIESLCSRFLWSGNIDNPKAVKISWETCYLPKDESGLGLRRFSIWNKALCSDSYGSCSQNLILSGWHDTSITAYA